ncbi:putative U3 small nucleolar RNA-associated protein 7 [Saitoella coloradoensis]
MSGSSKKVDPSLTVMNKYERGDRLKVKGIKDKKLRSNMKKVEHSFHDAAYKAADSELLLQEEEGVLEAEGMERTYKFRQDQLRQEVDVATAQKSFDLKLPAFGPYAIDYTRNGRHLLIGGRKGHVASFDWREGKLHSEIQLNETVRDVKWLHNESMYAVAQKKHVFIYDRTGMELHRLKNHIEVQHMEFLPYHFLLATVGNAGWLKYQDTSTGNLVAELRTKLGQPACMTQNQQNAAIHVGHANGTVTLWAPTMSTPLVKLQTHSGPVRSMAVDRSGKYMATGGAEGRLRIWDLRMYKEVHSYYTPTPPSTINISDRGLLAVGWGPHMTVWKDALRVKQQSPYMTHLAAGEQIVDARFCPFDDVLGFGHTGGFSSIVVPGSGEPNYDAYELNPYETVDQRRETEVRMLMEKIQPSMIALDTSFIGTLDRTSAPDRRALQEEEAAAKKAEEEKWVPKPKVRGKNSAMRKFLRSKAKNVIDDRRVRVEAALVKEKQMRAERVRRDRGEVVEEKKEGPALARFAQKTSKRY